MPTLRRIPLLAAAVLLSAMAAATAAPIPPAPAPAPSMPGVIQGTGPIPGGATTAAPQEQLHIGLSDPSTKLVLPWFITELKDAVNQGKSAEETAKGLAQGF